MHPVLREHAAERLLDRYLAEQGYVDLLKRRRPYRKKIGDLTPVDLPALVEADRQKAEKSAERKASGRSSSGKRRRGWSGCSS